MGFPASLQGKSLQFNAVAHHAHKSWQAGKGASLRFRNAVKADVRWNIFEHVWRVKRSRQVQGDQNRKAEHGCLRPESAAHVVDQMKIAVRSLMAGKELQNTRVVLRVALGEIIRLLRRGAGGEESARSL